MNFFKDYFDLIMISCACLIIIAPVTTSLLSGDNINNCRELQGYEKINWYTIHTPVTYLEKLNETHGVCCLFSDTVKYIDNGIVKEKKVHSNCIEMVIK